MCQYVEVRRLVQKYLKKFWGDKIKCRIILQNNIWRSRILLTKILGEKLL